MSLRPHLTLLISLAAAMGCLLPSAAQPVTPSQTPRTLVEKAIALSKSDKPLPRYTYFNLDHTQNRDAKGKLFLDSTTLYEYTWIEDRPYGRAVEYQGKPLKGKALAQEQARYDQAVADHAGLDIDARAKAAHHSFITTNLTLASLLTPAYTLSELRQETLGGTLTHVIDCTPIPSTDPAHPAATRHAALWITDSGTILRDTYEVLADEPDRMRGSRGQQDFQLIDGNQLPQHSTFHLNSPNGKTGDFEDTYSRFRRFSTTTRILPAGDPPADSSPGTQR